MTETDLAVYLSAARVYLQQAHAELDDAVRALPPPETDNMMATPVVVALLVRVRAAKNRLHDLEALDAARTKTGTPARRPSVIRLDGRS
jgi:hypothetical protein